MANQRRISDRQTRNQPLTCDENKISLFSYFCGFIQSGNYWNYVVLPPYKLSVEYFIIFYSKTERCEIDKR